MKSLETHHDSHGGEAAHGHSHHPHLAHHFDSLEQQYNTAKLGMWLFLAQEILFFGGLFCAYSIYRALNPDLFHYCSQLLDRQLGAVNTVVLLISSLTMAMAVRTSQLRQKTPTFLLLLATFICAGTFMVVKYFEYEHKVHDGTVMAGVVRPGENERHFFWTRGFRYDPFIEHDRSMGELRATASQMTYAPSQPVRAYASQREGTLNPPPSGSQGGMRSEIHHPELNRVPEMGSGSHPEGSASGHTPAGAHGQRVFPEGERPRDLHIFFGIYFALTGLHGIHVLAGMIMLLWMMWGVLQGRHVDGHFTAIDLGGLYWHLVDLVWIFLFPLLYLIG